MKKPSEFGFGLGYRAGAKTGEKALPYQGTAKFNLPAFCVELRKNSVELRKTDYVELREFCVEIRLVL